MGQINASRRRTILLAAGKLFGERGYSRVSVEDIGAAVGISGPGIYRHFGGKLAILIELSDFVCSHLLEGAREIAEQHTRLEDRLRALVRFHAEFAVSDGAMIRMYLQEEPQLPAEDRHRLRRIQRMYMEEWMTAYTGLNEDEPDARALTVVHAAIGAINSVAYHKAGLATADAIEVLTCRGVAVLFADSPSLAP